MAQTETIKLVDTKITDDDIHEYIIEATSNDYSERSDLDALKLTDVIMEEIYDDFWQTMKRDFYKNQRLHTHIYNKVIDQFDHDEIWYEIPRSGNSPS